MRIVSWKAAVLAAALGTAPLTAQESVDARLAALTDGWYTYQLAEYHQVEQPDGSTESGDRFWSATPAANQARAAELLRA